jgi:hypothetical protein
MSIYGSGRILIAPRGFSLDEQGKLKREKGQATTRAPVQDDLAERQDRSKAEYITQRKQERGVIGEFFDRITGQEPEAPEAYTRTGLAARQKEIAAERQRLAASAVEFDRLAAIAAKENRGRAASEAFASYKGKALDARKQAAALARELDTINRTGLKAPEANKFRETLSAAPRVATSILAGIPGALTYTAGRGLGAIGAPGAEALKATGASDIAAAKKLAEDVFGAEGEALQYDPTSKFIADVSGGVGSLGTFLVPGGAARLAGAGKGLTGAARAEAVATAARPFQYGLGMTQGAQQGIADIQATEQRTGKAIPDANAFGAILLNAGLGATEVGVANRIFERIPVAERGAAVDTVVDLIRRGTAGRVDPTAIGQVVARTLADIESRAVGRIAVRGGAEAAQESGVQLGSNLIAKGLYDPERDVTENVAYAGLVGGVVGGGVRSGVEVAQRFGQRGEGQEQQQQQQKPLEVIEAAIADPDNPSLVRTEKLELLSEADEEGNVTVRREDGRLVRMNVDSLDSMRVPMDTLRGSDAFGADMIVGRLQHAAGDKPEAQAAGFVRSVSRKLANDLAQGKVQESADYLSALEKRFSGVRKKQAAKEAAEGGVGAITDPSLRVLFEGKSILNDYRVEYAKQKAQPGARVELDQPSSFTSLRQTLEQNAAAANEQREERNAILEDVIRDSSIVNKNEAFSERLTDYGLDEITDDEANLLLDVMHVESAFETASAKGQESVQRQAALRRTEIIDEALSDPNIDLPNRIRKVNAALTRAGFEPTSEQEIRRIRGRSYAENVFGPSGEYQKRLDEEQQDRDAVLEEVMLDDSITDKYRAFVERADELGLAAPTADELEIMRGGAAQVERAMEKTRPKKAETTPTEELVDEAADEGMAPTVDEGAEVETGVVPVEDTDTEEFVDGVKVTKVAPGDATGARTPQRGRQGIQRGRPVKGAAEITGGMMDEQELNKRLSALRNTNQLSDADVASIMSMVRAPTSREALDKLPAAQRDRWLQALENQRTLQAQITAYEEATKSKDKKRLAKAIKSLEVEQDGLRSAIAKGAMREAAFLSAKRQNKRRQIEQDYTEGKIDARERRIQLAELKVDTTFMPVLSLREDFASELITNPDAANMDPADLAQVEQVAEGTEQIIARLDQAVLDGDIAQEHADFTKWVLSNNPNLTRYASLFVSKGGIGAAGQYDPITRIIELVASKTSKNVAVHEVMHHAERLMPESAQQAIYGLWSKQLNLRRKVATGDQKLYYDAIHDYYFGSGNPTAIQLARMLIMDRAVPRNLYQFMTPSEFWAENATDILRRKYDARDSVLSRIRLWLNEFAAYIGRAAGLPTRSPIMRALRELANTTGNAKSDKLIVGLEGTAFSLEEQLRDNPNRPREDTVGLMARMQQVGKQLKEAQSTAIRKLFYDYQDIVDEDARLAELYGVDQLPNNMALSHRTELLKAKRSAAHNKIDRDYIQPIIERIAELQLDPQDIGMYLWARSAKDRNALVRSRNAEYPDAGSGMTDAEANAILKDYALRGLEPQLREIAKMHDRLVDYMLNVRVKAGLLTRKQANEQRAAQPFYAALKGYAVEGDMQAVGDPYAHNEAEYRSNLGVRRTEYSKAGGRKSMPHNPLQMLFVDAHNVVQRASMNQVGERLVANMINDPEAYEGVARYYTDTDPKIRRRPSDNIEYPDGMQIRENMAANASDYLIVKHKGTTYYVEFDNTDAGKALRRAFSNMQPQALEGFEKVRVVTANALKSMLTRYSPPYLPKAYFRDTQDAVANAYTAQTDKASPAFGKKLGALVAAYATPASRTGRLIDGAITRHLAGLSPETRLAGSLVREKAFGKESNAQDMADMMLLLEQMMEDGGSPGHAIVHDLEALTLNTEKQLKQLQRLKDKDPRAYALAAPKAVLATLDATSQFIDLRARMATYVAALEVGIDREGAARLALNSSLNLTRRGEWARTLDSVFFFWSPAMESARRFKRMTFNSSNGRKVILAQMAIGAMLQVWNMMRGGEDDDEDGRPNYMDIPDTTKYMNLIIRTGSGTDDYVAMPVGFMLAFPTFVGQKMTEAAYGAITDNAAAISMIDALKSVGAGAVSIFAPVKPTAGEASTAATAFVPNIGKPFADVMINRNYFDTPIYTEAFSSDRAASSLGREETGRIYKWLATSLNNITGGSGTIGGGTSFQPESFRYLFEAYAGGLYRTVEDTVTFITDDRNDDKPLQQRLPIVRAYVGKGGEYAAMNQFFKNTEDTFAAPFVLDQPNMGAIVRQQKHEPEQFEESRKKYPLRTNEEIIEAYKVAKSELDRIGREQREELAEVDDRDTRINILDGYRAQKNEVYKEYNRKFNEVAQRYR